MRTTLGASDRRILTPLAFFPAAVPIECSGFFVLVIDQVSWDI